MQAQSPQEPTRMFINGRFATLDRKRPQASAVAIRDSRFLAVGFAALALPAAILCLHLALPDA